MTVCVVAIASLQNDPVLVGAADRMVTAGDVEFEQEQRKIMYLTRSISIMSADDLTIQADVLQAVMLHRNQFYLDFPDVWIGVKQVAEWFYDELASIVRRRAEKAILAPLDLTFEKLVSPDVSKDLARDLSKELLEFQIGAVQAIVFGIDTSGAHIYEVNNYGVTCHDWTGFASIGVGAWHSNSQMMFAGHIKARTLAETLLLVYTSKKRAEVAPGVGAETDMVVIGPGLGSSTTVGPPVMAALVDTFDRVQEETRIIRERENAQINQYIAEVLREAADVEEDATVGELQTDNGTEADANG